jgi:hypothetical protein
VYGLTPVRCLALVIPPTQKTKTSGTPPTGPVNSKTGRSFMPALPPKGKRAK